MRAFALATLALAPLLGAAKVVPMPEPDAPSSARPVWFQPERHRQVRENNPGPVERAREPGGPRILRVPDRGGVGGAGRPDG